MILFFDTETTGFFDDRLPVDHEAQCIQHFFGEKLDGAHDAMNDLAACKRVYLHLKSIEAAK
jgi:hypothetical protein